MKALVLVILLLAVPMAVLNPLGRPAFLGYDAGVAAMWAVFMMASASAGIACHRAAIR